MKLGGSGMQDWLVQRFTAFIIALYTLFVLAYIFFCPLDYERWHSLFSTPWMRIATIITLLGVAWHAWIGLWTVSTDYIKSSGLRLVFQWLVLLALFAYVLWGIIIVWG